MNEYLAIDSGGCLYEQPSRINCSASVCFSEKSGLCLIDEVCLCLSDETIKAVGPFYLVYMLGDVKHRT